MTDFLTQIQVLVKQTKYEITTHAFIELNEDNLLAGEIISGLVKAVVVEIYPDYHKGPSVLVLQYDGNGDPVHALWGIPKGKIEPAFLITAYRPDIKKWLPDFLTRRPK